MRQVRDGDIRARKRSRVDSAGSAFRGSQRQIQLYVNEHTAMLSEAIVAASSDILAEAEIEWVSPLQEEKYQEYWDGAFLNALGLGAFSKQLADFWPKGGPHWDALAKLDLRERPECSPSALVGQFEAIEEERVFGSS